MTDKEEVDSKRRAWLPIRAEEYDLIKEMYNEGIPVGIIAKELGRVYQAIRYRIEQSIMTIGELQRHPTDNYPNRLNVFKRQQEDNLETLAMNQSGTGLSDVDNLRTTVPQPGTSWNDTHRFLANTDSYTTAICQQCDNLHISETEPMPGTSSMDIKKFQLDSSLCAVIPQPCIYADDINKYWKYPKFCCECKLDKNILARVGTTVKPTVNHNAGCEKGCSKSLTTIDLQEEQTDLKVSIVKSTSPTLSNEIDQESTSRCSSRSLNNSPNENIKRDESEAIGTQKGTRIRSYSFGNDRYSPLDLSMKKRLANDPKNDSPTSKIISPKKPKSEGK